jgi:uncharacterized membrane protein YbhN (UPF0104 family)
MWPAVLCYTGTFLVVVSSLFGILVIFTNLNDKEFLKSLAIVTTPVIVVGVLMVLISSHLGYHP